jgi:endo-1,4-beta-xylanase
MSPRIRVVRRIVAWTAVILVASGAVLIATVGPGQAAGPLRTVSGSRFIGYAANASLLCNNTSACTSGSNATYRGIADTEFNQVTPENALKWDATEPNQGQFTFTQADGIVANAVANNQIVHGHTLLWHNQIPGWVQSLSGTALRNALQNHISTVVGHYASNPAVRSWDVVNEVVNDSSSPQLRQDFWTQNYPGDFVHDAFTFARAADPDALLCINDYGVEGSPDTAGSKAQRLFQLVQAEKAMGTPIDCVGLQSHFIVGQIPDLAQSIARYASLGVSVRISELDIRIPLPGTAAQFQIQASNYATVVNACKAVAACLGITIWGIDDGHSWLPNSCCPEGVPLLWDASFVKKPAYDATANAFSPAPPPTTPPTTTPPPTSGGGCTITLVLQTQWQTGYVIQPARVTNTGTADISGWTVTVTLPAGHAITGFWNATESLSGQTVTFHGVSFNSHLAPGASGEFGFQASRPDGSAALPTTATCAAAS